MSGEPKSWQSYIDQFLVYSEVNCRVNTIRSRKFHLKTLRGYFGDIPLEALKPEHLEQYKRQRLALGLSKSTINGELKVLRQITNMAWEGGHLEKLPIRRWRLLPMGDFGRTRVLTPEEEVRLLLTSKPKLRAMIALSLNTGMRGGEVCALCWEWVDFQARLITLPADHVCRHTFATRLTVAGVPIVAVKELMRHATIQMTMRYSHPQIDHLRSAVDQLCSPL